MKEEHKKSELDGMSIGDRMKFNYEFPFIYRLPDRMPVIIRIDGRAFHTLVRKIKLNKPFDKNFMDYMRIIAA